MYECGVPRNLKKFVGTNTNFGPHNVDMKYNTGDPKMQAPSCNI
jgi:hypothetical protein